VLASPEVVLGEEKVEGWLEAPLNVGADQDGLDLGVVVALGVF